MSRWHSQLVAAWVGKEGSTAKNRIRYDPHTIGGYCARSWLHRKLTWILQWSELSREARLSKMADVVEGGRASLQTSMRHRERATCDHMQACRRRKHARQAPERCTFASLFLPSCPPLAPSRFEGSGWMCLLALRALTCDGGEEHTRTHRPRTWHSARRPAIGIQPTPSRTRPCMHSGGIHLPLRVAVACDSTQHTIHTEPHRSVVVVVVVVPHRIEIDVA